MLRLALVLAALLAAVPAWSQESPRRPGETRPAPTVGQRVVVAARALGGGALTVGLVGPFAPLAIGAATYAASAALGLHPTVGGVALDTAVGTAAGVAVYAATVFYVTEIEGRPHEFGVDMLGVFAGLTVAAVTTGVVHGERLARLRTPGALDVGHVVRVSLTGRRGAGVAVGLRL